MTVVNRGRQDKGLAAEELSLTVPVLKGLRVISATGSGYQGVHHDERIGTDVALWKFPRLAAGDKQVFAVTLSGPGGETGLPRDTILRWMKPQVGGGSPVDAVRVLRVPTPPAQPQ